MRVINLGTYVAGPYAGTLLSELGADVIKIEAVGGDPFRVPGFTYNRGMRSVALDIRTESGREALYAAVRGADVVLDNARAGVMRRLRADYEALREHKPDIVSVSVSSFGVAGPLAGRPAFDPVLQAMSGLMSAQGGDDDPVMLTISVNDVTAAALCAYGACLGLYQRLRTGRGQALSTSLAAASLYAQGEEYVRFAGRPPLRLGGRDFRGRGAGRYLPVADGWIRVEAADAAQLEQLDEDELAGSSRADAVKAVAGLGLRVAPARPFSEVRHDPDLLALELTHEFRRSDGTSYTTPGRFALFDRTPRTVRLRAPGIGEHTEEVLGEIGMDPDRIAGLLRSGLAAQGRPYDPVIFNYR